MTIYNNFIGIDIGKSNFVINVHGQKSTKEYNNDEDGILTFIKEYNKELSTGLCIVETTGGYEMELLLTLCSRKLSVHRASGTKIKNFIRSWGDKAKTDSLDAKALALYGSDRNEALVLFHPKTDKATELLALTQRRQDLTKSLVAEKNRAKAPNNHCIKNSIDTMIRTISAQLELLTKQINEIFEQDRGLSERKKTIKTIPGIGDVTANALLALVPELGELNRRQIASLVGLAPKANDSGKRCGYRRTNKGRSDVKPILFTAAMAARRSHSQLRNFYEQLIKRGKKKMVALTALMRKMIVIANARLRDLNNNQLSNKHS